MPGKRQKVNLAKKFKKENLIDRIYYFCSNCPYRDGNKCKGYKEEGNTGLIERYKGCEFKDIINLGKIVFTSK